MFTLVLSLPLHAAEPAPSGTQLAPDTAVVVAESDLVAALGSVGTSSQVALLTANKPQENALEDAVGESAGYRYLRAGSASEVRGSLREAGLQCGVFLAPKGKESWRATLIGDCETSVAAGSTPSSEPSTNAP